MSPVQPPESVTLKTMLLAPLRVAPVQLMAVPLAMPVMTLQVLPLSTEPYRMSPTASAALKVPVMVCDAVLVMKSLALVPLSALMSTALTVRSCAGVNTCTATKAALVSP